MTLYQELRERGARDGRELVEVEPTGERAIVTMNLSVVRPGRNRFDSEEFAEANCFSTAALGEAARGILGRSGSGDGEAA